MEFHLALECMDACMIMKGHLVLCVQAQARGHMATEGACVTDRELGQGD